MEEILKTICFYYIFSDTAGGLVGNIFLCAFKMKSSPQIRLYFQHI
jgi:hypothetical protein